MTKLYRVTSPQEIIDHFERRAEYARNNANQCREKQRKTPLIIEANTWKEAASILRDTEFVGWEN